MCVSWFVACAGDVTYFNADPAMLAPTHTSINPINNGPNGVTLQMIYIAASPANVKIAFSILLFLSVWVCSFLCLFLWEGGCCCMFYHIFVQNSMKGIFGNIPARAGASALGGVGRG